MYGTYRGCICECVSVRKQLFEIHHNRIVNKSFDVRNTYSRRDSFVSGGTTKAPYFFYETTWAYLSFKKTLTQSDAWRLRSIHLKLVTWLKKRGHNFLVKNVATCCYQTDHWIWAIYPQIGSKFTTTKNRAGPLEASVHLRGCSECIKSKV